MSRGWSRLAGRSRRRWLALARQLVSYAVFGGLGALTDVAVYLLLVKVVGTPPVPSNILSVCCGIAVSFALNSRFTFGRQDRSTVRLVRFFMVGLTGLAISTVLLAVLVNQVGVPPHWAKLLTVPPVVLGQFLTNRMWTFAHLPDASEVSTSTTLARPGSDSRRT